MRSDSFISYVKSPNSVDDFWLQEEQGLWNRLIEDINTTGPPIGTIMDVGAGLGKLSFLLSDQLNVPYSRVYAIEPDSLLFETAINDITLKGINFISTTIETLDIRLIKSGVDLIGANMVMHHLDDCMFLEAMSTLLEVLNPSGQFAYLIPHPWFRQIKYDNGPYFGSRVISSRAPWGDTLTYWHRTLEQYLLLTQFDNSKNINSRFILDKIMESEDRMLISFRKSVD